MESTYGDRFHKHTGDHVENFAKVIEETLDRGGNVVIPAFAVGRTQEVSTIREIKEKHLVKGHDNFLSSSTALWRWKQRQSLRKT